MNVQMNFRLMMQRYPIFWKLPNIWRNNFQNSGIFNTNLHLRFQNMGNNDDIKARLRRVLEEKKSNVSKITEGENVKRSTLSAQINGNSAVSYDTIKLFLRKFADLSADWLLKGEGMMCGCSPDDPSLYGKTPSASGTIGSTEVQRTHNGGTTEAERIKFLEEQVAFYKEQTAYYKEMAERKSKQ